jgi:uncharacterized protein YndB with AHSA1/START domain
MNSENTKPLVVEQEYNVPKERVWQALTDKEQMKRWYFTLDDFKPEEGFEFTFPGQGQKGEQYIHICRITEVIPNKKLQHTWSYKGIEGSSRVTFELFEEGNKTRLKFTHEGLETFPKHNPDFAKESFKGGWTELLTVLLKKYLED